MLKANEVKMTITVVNISFSKTMFGPSLVGEVVITISIPMTAKATEAQMNTFVAIFCPDIVVDPRCSTKSASGHNLYIYYIN